MTTKQQFFTRQRFLQTFTAAKIELPFKIFSVFLLQN
jgi:hypothetical protein